jgi:predicted transcriptional regulator
VSAIDVMVPAQPLVEWMRELRRREARRLGVSEMDALGAVAETLGLSRRRVSEYVNGRAGETLCFDTVDKIVSSRGDTVREVYPGVMESVVLPDPATTYTCRGCGFEMLAPARLCGFCVKERKSAHAGQ